MVDDAALAAAAEVVASIAADQKTITAALVVHPEKFKLPGRDTPAKLSLEAELQKLALRVGQLESRASAAVTFPETPNEGTDSLFGDEAATSPSGSRSVASRSRTHNSAENPAGVPRQLTKEALEGLREHVDDQSKLLDSQRQELAGVNAQLLEQKQLQEKALEVLEQERISTLERELWKHQKANEAFQKALREIGEIVTAVARGDLTMKVRMNLHV
jgi:osomolarity two-component system sensor histidine kinase NIK1